MSTRTPRRCSASTCSATKTPRWLSPSGHRLVTASTRNPPPLVGSADGAGGSLRGRDLASAHGRRRVAPTTTRHHALSRPPHGSPSGSSYRYVVVSLVEPDQGICAETSPDLGIAWESTRSRPWLRIGGLDRGHRRTSLPSGR